MHFKVYVDELAHDAEVGTILSFLKWQGCEHYYITSKLTPIESSRGRSHIYINCIGKGNKSMARLITFHDLYHFFEREGIMRY